MPELSEGIELCTVRVADISEFPTALGSRCLLLHELGLDAYWNTDEEVLHALNESVNCPEHLKICKNDSRCRAFWEKYQQGITPFNERDPIRLIEYGGRYWAKEGKHRVCMAKRSGVERIEAYVWALRDDEYSLIPQEGKPGHFIFRCVYTLGRYRRGNGNIAVLWVQSPRGNPPSRFDFGPAALDNRMDTHGELRSVFPGLSYSVSVSEQKSGLMRFKKEYIIESEVRIAEYHAKTKIWLLNGAVKDVFSPYPVDISKINTVYRYGCWRKHHLRYTALHVRKQ